MKRKGVEMGKGGEVPEKCFTIGAGCILHLTLFSISSFSSHCLRSLVSNSKVPSRVLDTATSLGSTGLMATLW